MVFDWLRSLRVQLVLWAILPVTFVVIAFAFTGVYAHQQAMYDFVAARDLALVKLAAHSADDGLRQGAVQFDGTGLDQWMLSDINGHQARLYVVDGAGLALVHPDASRLNTSLRDDPELVEGLNMYSATGSEGSIFVTGSEGESILIAFAPVEDSDWLVLLREPVDDLIGPILRLSSVAPIVAVVSGCISLLVLALGWRTIVRPLRDLSRAAEQVSWGDFSAISRCVGGVQEVRDLRHALFEMGERIRGYETGVRDYLGAVTRGQEAERARLARELHDGPVQELIALGQRAEMAQRLVERGDVERALVLLGELRIAELGTVEELRRLIGALRPIYLEDLGFLPALEMLTKQMDELTPARVRLEREGVVHRISSAVELAAYRIAQEALNNAVQHAQAQNIVVRVRSDSDGLTLSVVDDGIGFTLPSQPDLLTRAGHFGLVGMRERAVQLGGVLRVLTAQGEGTSVVANLPAG